uniref:DUF4939 domain-containing protein n=1 Tax=Nothobranchius furzeri TaxID=105023 RepID=A0A8C6K622_NOTFU
IRRFTNAITSASVKPRSIQAQLPNPADQSDRMTESLNPAEFERMKNEIVQLHALVDWLNTKVNSLTDLTLQLSTSINALQQQALAPPKEEPQFSLPERWNGEVGSPDRLLASLDMQFECQPGCFPTARSRVAHLTSLLSGRAQEWAAALYNSKSPACNDYAAFVAALRKTFVPPRTHLHRLTRPGRPSQRPGMAIPHRLGGLRPRGTLLGTGPLHPGPYPYL